MNLLGQIFTLISSHLLALGISLLFLMVAGSRILSPSPKKIRSKVITSVAVVFILNVIIFLFLSRFVGILTKTQNFEYYVISFGFLILFSIFININSLLILKNIFVRYKRDANDKDISVEMYKQVNISIIFLLLVVPMYFIGNKSINGLLVLIFLAVLVSSFTLIVLFPKILRFFEKSSD